MRKGFNWLLIGYKVRSTSFPLRHLYLALDCAVSHYYSTLKMEAVRYSETVATKYQTTLRHIPEGINNQSYKVSNFTNISHFLIG
jgi:hypothetical protein